MKNYISYNSILVLFFIITSLDVYADMIDGDTTILSIRSYNKSEITSETHAIKNDSEDKITINPVLYNENLTGNWFGLRNLFDTNGLDFGIRYTGDFFSNLSKQKNYYLDNFLLSLDIDAGKFSGLENTGLYVSILGNSGSKPNEITNSFQGVDNIEAYSTWKLYELQLRTEFIDNKFSLLFGLYDYNSEFDIRENSSYFINPSHGIGIDIAQSGENGPSIFPTTSLAFRLAVKPNEILTVRTAIFDGVPGLPDDPKGTHINLAKDDGYLLASEIDFDLSKYNKDRLFNLKIGSWYYTEPLFSQFRNEIDPLIEYHNYGFYLSAEADLISKNTTENSGLGYFLRTGYANPEVNKIEYYLGAGLVYKDLFGDGDILGLAIASGFTGDSFNDYLIYSGFQSKAYETNLELTYCILPVPWLTIQPDFQLMINPLGLDEKTNHFFGGLRINLNL